MIRYKIFLRIVENGSFTKTGEEFGYTQSAISQTVKSLEDELKVHLFTRTKHGIFLTSDGKAMLPYVKKLCDDYEQIIARSSDINHLDGATIRIGSFASLSANFLPMAIKGFVQIYPNVHFKLLQGDYESIKLWINDGTVDFGFLTEDVATKLESSSFLSDEMVMILPSDHKKANKKDLILQDFADEPFIFLDQGKLSEPMEYFKRAGIEPTLKYRVYDDYTIMNMVEQGLGVAILPKLVLYRHHQNIIVRSLTPPLYRDMVIAYKSKESLSLAGKYFMEFAIEYAKSNNISL